jgi:hypothetical protein
MLTQRSTNRGATALLVLGLVMLALPAHAGVFRLGVQGSGGINSVSGDLPEEGSWQSPAVFGGGISAEFNFTANMALSFQPSLAPRDTRRVFKDELGQIIFSTDYDLNYLSLPLIVRVTADPLGVRGFVTAGLDVSVLMDATASSGTASQDVSDQFDSTNFGALFGAGVMVPISRHYFTFEARYVQGIDDMVARGSGDTDSDLAGPSVKYRGLHLVVGFLFTFGGE